MMYLHKEASHFSEKLWGYRDFCHPHSRGEGDFTDIAPHLTEACA